ncbi:hypothetical protein OO013_01760 [Mangrovivirga sp. M17]|uniref:Gliding motility protein SprA N-terminal domain-containing protein n=1 Tax=Mangrovivirga halotolerans TaxID=2993936 RepID=A0ABT3RMG0_9BACT|nr:hypothetical protein [Mangrovivirga halotolerans]MCX2742569.1 hypothetical protein [Mangrovivirga halotolerans]
MRYVVLIILITAVQTIFGQERKEICVSVEVSKGDTLKINADSIILNSLYVKSAPANKYQSINNETLVWNGENQSITICYLKPDLIFNDLYRYSYDEYDSNAFFYDKQVKKSALDEVLPLEDKQLQTSGVLSRAVNSGTNSDAGIQSELLLNLSGKLSDDISINARISDRNIPYQPEGNTAQLQDFDKVFIEVFNDKYYLEAGDIQIKNDYNHFLRYQKNVQGLGLAMNTGEDSVGTFAGIRGGINKGKFTTIYVKPIEGVSGPYRLSEGINELFPVVIANSERVYLDGRLMQRGYERDYVIDYNTAEITFSPDILITEFTRIRVDLEYAVLSYPRSTFNLQAGHKFKKGQLSIEYYSEQDNFRKPLRFENTDQIYQDLIDAGDTTQAIIAGYNRFEGDPDQTLEVLYLRKDTIVNNDTIRIFDRYKGISQADSLYKINFEYLGPGEGVYARTNEGGRQVFYWVGINGGSEASYAPVSIIPLPNKNSMLVLSGEIDITNSEKISFNTALNIHEKNRYYSRTEGRPDKGFANNISLTSRRKIGKRKLNQELSFDYIGHNFKGIDRFRNIEFDRDWGQARDTLSRENYFYYKGSLSDKKSNYSYKISYRDKKDVLNGINHEVSFDKQFSGWKASGAFNRMISEYYGNNNRWSRETVILDRIKGKFRPGYTFISERNVLRAESDDELISSLQYFYKHDIYIGFEDSSKNSLKAGFFYREDKIPIEGKLQDYNKSYNGYLKGRLNLRENHQVNGTVIIRSIDYQINKSDETYAQGRINMKGYFKNIGLRYNTGWNLQSSRELRRNFTFIEVPLGQGTHTWIDDNDNGIQELGEFYEAFNPDERKYSKVFTPGNDYVDAYLSRVDFLYRWNFSDFTDSDFLGGFSFNGNLIYEQKTTGKSFSERVNPFKGNIQSVIASNVLNNYLFKWRSIKNNWFIQYGHTIRSRRQLLFSGFDTYNTTRSRILVSVPITDNWTSELELESEFKLNEAENIEQKNYRIRQYILLPTLTWSPTSNLRAKLSFNRKQKIDLNSDVANKSDWQQLGISITSIGKGNFRGTLNFEFKNIDYDGEVNTVSGYQLLEGFRAGNNFLWSTNLRKEIFNGLVVNLYYQGRKPSNTRVIHFASLQGSILF